MSTVDTTNEASHMPDGIPVKRSTHIEYVGYPIEVMWAVSIEEERGVATTCAILGQFIEAIENLRVSRFKSLSDCVGMRQPARRECRPTIQTVTERKVVACR